MKITPRKGIETEKWITILTVTVTTSVQKYSNCIILSFPVIIKSRLLAILELD